MVRSQSRPTGHFGPRFGVPEAPLGSGAGGSRGMVATRFLVALQVADLRKGRSSSPLNDWETAFLLSKVVPVYLCLATINHRVVEVVDLPLF